MTTDTFKEGRGGKEATGQGENPSLPHSALSFEEELSGIRHSLRTPLNQILGYCEMLQEEAEENGKKHYLPDLQKLHSAGEQLLTLVNQNLTSAAVAARQMNVSDLQHGCRMVLNLIVGYCEICQENAAEEADELFEEDLQRIRTATSEFVKLLQDESFLRPLSQITSSRPVPPGLAVPIGTDGRTVGRPVSENVGGGLIGRILVVDDHEMNRDMLSRRLERQGHRVVVAEDGRRALATLEQEEVDLILLDILMPEMDGLQTLERLKAHPSLKHTPVIMLSALDEIDRVVRCIEVGADDYLTKPFNPILLRARIGACLEKKQLRDQEQAYILELRREREKSEELLLNILPASIAHRLKAGDTTIADDFPEATVLFADLVDFTRLASSVSAPELVRLLNDIFSQFDWLVELHRLEKIKTIGDAYMVVGGVPEVRPDHAAAIAELALDMRGIVERMDTSGGMKLNLRIGISSGPVVAGVIGSKKFIYDLWGDTVNTASRMESHGHLGEIQVSQSTYQLLRKKYRFRPRGRIAVKGKGRMTTYFLQGRR